MDLIQTWNDAIQRVAAATPDEQDKQIMNLFPTQVSLTIENNMIIFMCSSAFICSLFSKYTSQFYAEVCHLLGRQDMGFSVQIGSVQSALPKTMAPQLQPQGAVQPQLQGQPLQGAPGSLQQNYGENMYGTPRGEYQAATPSLMARQPRYDNYAQGQQGMQEMYEQPQAPAVRLQRPRFMRNDAINPNKTFENYVTDPDNRLLYATAVAVATNPGTSNYNPFYIYGGSGLGKTHLLFAIANRIRQNRPDCSMVYIRAEEFIRHYVESMAKGRQTSFSDQSLHFQDLYTENDVFIVDDIQNFAKSPKTRDTFFEIIAEFIDRPNRQLILASDVAPGNLKDFSARLTSRFGSGVCCEVFPPSAETRTAIVINKCKEIGLTLSDDIVNYVASHIRSNVREIEGALKTLFTQYSIQHSLTYDEAVRILSNLVNASNQVLSMDTIKERVAREFEIQVSSMESAERKKTVSLARSMAMALIRELISTASLKEIGRAFNKDHSSVHEAIQRIESKIKDDPELSARYHRLKLSLKNE
ncbi:MAG: chromosomal replication initiator protein DnaA [Proteobacteria bacterium]|uniref:Chromosomal replication initiator protein DnaA n=1 Tax=Candidatus Avisuccinivibrio stercorigallinarum TaxID=2840704 RepID=A0A9D9GR44_9GAMM|nr:chromosomal replication initiator protein DnaA [Candidatus Avisuccinivibrio stercorigallinarum]